MYFIIQSLEPYTGNCLSNNWLIVSLYADTICFIYLLHNIHTAKFICQFAVLLKIFFNLVLLKKIPPIPNDFKVLDNFRFFFYFWVTLSPYGILYVYLYRACEKLYFWWVPVWWGFLYLKKLEVWQRTRLQRWNRRGQLQWVYMYHCSS